MFKYLTKIKLRRRRKIMLWFFNAYPDRAERMRWLYDADIKGYWKTCLSICNHFDRQQKSGAPFGWYSEHTTRYSKFYGIKRDTQLVFLERKKAQLLEPKRARKNFARVLLNLNSGS